MSSGTAKKARVSLIKDISTSEGMVLSYLQTQHPLGISGNDGIVTTLMHHWLPLALKENGINREKYQKVAAYSVGQLLAQVDWIIKECDLPPLRQSDRIGTLVAGSDSKLLVTSNDGIDDRAVTSSVDSLEDNDSWLDEPSEIDYSDIVIDAGFRT